MTEKFYFNSCTTEKFTDEDYFNSIRKMQKLLTDSLNTDKELAVSSIKGILMALSDEESIANYSYINSYIYEKHHLIDSNLTVDDALKEVDTLCEIGELPELTDKDVTVIGTVLSLLSQLQACSDTASINDQTLLLCWILLVLTLICNRDH